MTHSIPTLIRRVAAAVGTLAVALAAAPIAAQTITLSGATGNSCTFGSMTVSPAGAITVSCNGTTNPPVEDPNIATFTLAGPTSVTIGTTPTFTVTRTAGPASNVAFGYTVSGAGCGWVSDGPFFKAKGEAHTLQVYPVAVGQCTISLVVQDGHKSTPTTGQVTFEVVTGTVDPPPPATEAIPVVAGCPAAATSARLKTLSWGETPVLRNVSGAVTAYKVPASQIGRASVTLTQAQTTVTPASPTMEMSVSRCPGVIETNLTQDCYRVSSFPNFNAITAFNRPLTEYGWTTQEHHAGYGCLAPAAQEQFYVNVRWTFPSCAFGLGVCGFSMQWGEGGY